jgi:hypothetical protein
MMTLGGFFASFDSLILFLSMKKKEEMFVQHRRKKNTTLWESLGVFNIIIYIS